MPATYRVIVTPAALEDLDRITEYIKQDSPQNALSVFNQLWQTCHSLSIFPLPVRSPSEPPRPVEDRPCDPGPAFHCLLPR